MLYWSIVFLVLSLVSAIFAFGGIALAAAPFAKMLFVACLSIATLGLFAAHRAARPTLG